MMRLTNRSLTFWLSSTALESVSAFRTPKITRNKFTTALSMSTLRVALCQFPVTDDTTVNHQTATTYIENAVEKGAELVVLPEIWNSPYATAAFPEYAQDLENGPSRTLLQSLATKYKLWLVGGSIPERTKDGKIYNTSLVFNPKGEVVAKHRKVHLFDIDVPGGITFFESDTLSPGETVSYFSTPWGNVGLGICYDIRFAEYAMLLTQKHDCKVLLYPGAFNMTTGPAHWELLQRARAVDNQCYVLTASPARVLEQDSTSQKPYPHYTAWGHSTAVSPWGEVIATTDEKPSIVMADLDMSKVEDMRKSIPIRNQRRKDLYELNEMKE